MKKNTFLLLLFITVNGLVNASGLKPIIETFKFATLEEGRKMLASEDEYTDQWSDFDIKSKFQKENSDKATLLMHASNQVREWSIEEKNRILQVLENFVSSVDSLGLSIKMPDEIYFIKSTAEEEGGAAGYTRVNFIVLKDEMVASDSPMLKHLIVHEIFHILSRHDAEMRRKLYNIIGFKMMDQITYPDSIKDYMVSNPDAPLADSYINLTVKGDSVACVMIIYSKRPYTGGSFFEYLNIGLLSLSLEGKKEPLLENDHPIIYTINEVDNLFTQIGKNTNYIINPEEILADNFTFLINGANDLPSQWVVDEMQKVLAK